ncbi:MAG: helix-turn-helix domain-containing protein [Micavibrio sp.]|nr:MAG: helix-turn-helix domain-containing protein [Micavibrio sp.]
MTTDEHNTGETTGVYLRRIREEKNLTLKQVAEPINLRAGQLEAIEKGDLSALPGTVYAIGFVRSYAAQLGLNGEAVAQRFKAEHAAAAQQQTELNISPPMQGTQLPSRGVLGGAAAIFVLVLLFWAVFLRSDNGDPAVETAKLASVPEVPPHLRVADITHLPPAEGEIDMLLHELSVNGDMTDEQTEEEETAQTEEVTVTETTAQTAAQAAAQTAAQAEEAARPRPAPVPPAAEERHRQTTVQEQRRATAPVTATEEFGAPARQSRITLHATDSSWIHVRSAEGETLFQQVLRPGQLYRAPDQPNMRLDTANAGGFDVYVDGEKAAPFGRAGDIIRGITLDADEIKRRSGRR